MVRVRCVADEKGGAKPPHSKFGAKMSNLQGCRYAAVSADLLAPQSTGRRRLHMKRVANSLTIATVVLFAVSVTAQTRPDFSGRWTSEPELTVKAPGAGGRSGEHAGDMGSGWGLEHHRRAGCEPADGRVHVLRTRRYAAAAEVRLSRSTDRRRRTRS